MMILNWTQIEFIIEKKMEKTGINKLKLFSNQVSTLMLN